ncbi:uncharacterized protein LOC141644347 [Silene latifolia]|uniref:uncharacterized protein LOC141644347 n=1 Tax=Silene latifolia TaxID=37657 RepID=UPI003D784C16
MPPSPSLGRSSRGDSRSDSHKRGRSLEGVLSFKEKDDDLALFNELQSRERQNFLLESTDDFEDLLSSRAKPFTDFKLGINIPVRGETSDLLNVDGDKNDYEWLLTPPETPLFSSLDDEPAAANLVHSGRARSRPISISRSSTMEKSQRSSRGSASPQRLSPSPRSGTSTFQGRPSSAPHSNPGLLRSSSPSRRPSPPPVKHLTPPPRSLTPTSRRSTGSSPSSMGMSGTRGISPARTSRGNSASPKVRAWQSNIPGFSLEAPPNLRTSLADRPASYVRGSSPASRTSRDSSSKFGRQSMSPTPSRSIGSSHSHDRDRLSSHSKGSIVSSGDDDADSLQSTPVSVSERPVSRKGASGYPGGRPLAFTKKSTKTFSPSSVPKRSFDSAIRDRRSPQSMFRPLLSSVPSSTFHSGKTSTAHHSLISRNSSVTTSSNASSDLATSAALDTEGSDQYQDDRATDCVRATSSDIHDEVFEFDKMDARPEDTAHESNHVSSQSAACGAPIGAGQLDAQGDVIIDGHSKILICSICGSRYRPDELSESEDNICFECKHAEPTNSFSDPLIDHSEESQFEAPLSDSQSRDVSEITQNQECTPEAAHHDSQLSNLENMDVIPEQQVAREHRTLDDPSDTSNINAKEGAGISVLLNRSSSVKGPIAHGRTINSSAISFEDLSYARDLTSSLRSSVGHGSFSASSSIDLTSARHGDTFVRRQLSGKLSDSNSKPQSTVSSFSGTSVPVYQSVGLSTSSHEGSLEGSLGNVRHIVSGERPTTPSDQVASLENAELLNNDPSAARAPITEASVGESHDLHEIDEGQEKRIGHVENASVSELDETLLAEEGTTSENRNNRIPEEDVEEDPLQCSLSTMSEIEISDSHPSSPGSQIDVVFGEDLEDSSTLMHHDTNGKDASLEYAESDHADIIVEESTVAMEDQEGKMRKSLTLEEATDTILFCNSIIHDLAYKAASIAIEKEKENLEPFERPRPTLTIPDRRDPRGFSSSRTPKSQKARKKRTTETEVKPPLMQNDEKSNEPMVRNVGIPNYGNSMKPPKLESKCNCTIM